MQSNTLVRTARAVLVSTLLIVLAAAPGAALAAPAGAGDVGVPGWSLWQRLTETAHGWLAAVGSGFGVAAAASSGAPSAEPDPGGVTDAAGIIADPNGLTGQAGIITDPGGGSGQGSVGGQAGIIGDPNG